MHFKDFVFFSDISRLKMALGIMPGTENLGGDELVLPLVAKGDQQAMKRCIQQYGPVVWSIINRRIHHRLDAEETCQEVFTEVWRKAGSYDSAKSRESTFIGLIARRRSIDWQRKQSRLPQLSTLESSPDIPLASSPPPGANIDRKMIWEALSSLPEQTRELFALHFEKGMTHEEISDHAKIPLGTVKTQLRRGLIKARRLLKDISGKEGPRS